MYSKTRATIGAIAASVLWATAASAAPQTSDTFTVTTAADNGSNAAPTVGSLRWAIKQANASASVTTIDFALSGCPTILNLAGTAFPDITTDVTIDGYSQAGAIPNAHFGKFDATLCVVLNGAGSIATGLHTSGSGRLSVRGLALTGFTDAAVRLDSGVANIVAGNQFGGIAFAVANKDGVRIAGTATALVGDFSDPAGVNMIVGGIGTGVYIDAAAGGSAVVGDLIGIGADGAASIGNNLGVYLFDSPGNEIENCVIGNNTQQGVLIAGPSTSGTLLTANDIGSTANGAHAANGAEGVQVTFGAHDNTIGAAQTDTTGGNTIYSLGSAVAVTASGGVHNRILANQQMYSGNSLPVDLGAAGPTANDAGDGDAGANDLQNFPVLLHAYRTPAANWAEGTLDSAPNDAFRIDVYWGPCCAAGGGRGNATYFAGRGSSVTDASGHAHFWVKLPAVTYPSVGAMSATATAVNGDTSEMGVFAQEILGEMIFRDDFEG